MSPRWRKTLIAWTLSLAPLAVIAWAVQARWSDVSDAGGLPGVVPVVLAVVGNIVGNLLLIFAWRHQVGLAGERPPAGAAISIWSTSQLSRLFFPGAAVGARAVLGRKHGIRAAVGAWTTVLELGWQFSIGPLVILLTLPAWRGVAAEWTWLAVLAIGPGALLLALVARPVRAVRLLANVLHRVPILSGRVPDVDDVAVNLDRGEAGRLFGVYAANYAIRTAVFVVLFLAYAPGELELVAIAVGASALGRFVGMLMLFAPGGIGPREGVIALMLGPTLGSSVLVLVGVARLAEIIAEAIVYATGRVLVARSGGLPEGEPPIPEAAARG